MPLLNLNRAVLLVKRPLISKVVKVLHGVRLYFSKLGPY